MNNPVIADLVRRVERLERLLAEMRVGEEGGREEPVVDPREQPVQPIEPLSLGPSPLKAGARAVASGSARSERFLSRVGIGFVLLALAFLLKLSFDRGWITPMIRLVLGGTCGVALLAVGLRLESDRRRLAQAFLGGGVATFYLVAFAGFRLYGLIPFWPALLVMTATTFLSYALSDRQDVASLAVIGVSGGLATPFLLDAAAGDPGSLASYATVVLLGAGAVQLHRGWSSLLAMMTVGGASVVAAMASSPVSTAAVAVTGATFVYWLVVSVSPLLRIRYGRRPPEEERPGYSMGVWVARSGWVVGTGVAVGAVAEVWDMGRVSSGLLLLGIAGGAGLFAFASARHLLSRIVAGELAALTAAAGPTHCSDNFHYRAFFWW